MKLNIIRSSFAIFALAALASCSEGQYWEEPTLSQAYAFAKPVETVTVGASESFPSSFEITVSRVVAGGEETIPVTLETNTSLLTGPASVTFAAGEHTATYTLSAATGMGAGPQYTATLTLQQPEGTTMEEPEDNQSFSLTVTQELNWIDAGTAQVYSAWVGNEEPIEVPMQVSTNYYDPDMMMARLHNLYYVMEPEYVADITSIQFIIDKEGNVTGYSPSWQYIGELNSDDTYFCLGLPAAYGCSFTNDGNIYTLNGLIATTPSLTSMKLSPINRETVQFIWDMPK